ncbi:HD-GYP domain-containing protein [Actinospica robiniae]|uniref:HD-GYP domain-containing protein n=1 Tax=Actinospica robiniae TaxID=304901 RepID=UPI0004294035|nr:hypothetical protein [Actinospica robiniae]
MKSLHPTSRTHAVLAAATVLGFLAAVVRLCVDGPVQTRTALVFAAVIAVGEAMRLTLPNGRDNAPLAATAGLGYALVYQIGGHPAAWSAAQVVVVVTIAAAVGSVPQILAGRPPGAGYLIRRVGVTGFIAAIARTMLHGELSNASHEELLLLFSGLACIALLLDTAWAAVFTTTASPDLSAAYQVPMVQTVPTIPTDPAHVRASAKREDSGARRRINRFLTSWGRECAATARVCPAVAALSVAVALAASPLGLWVLLIASAPILVMQRALRRYAAIRATYQQTIRALSRITDLAGYTEPGHARRVCRLALAIGRELGMGEPELLDLEYAALLHDLGQLSLADPLPGGATVSAPPAVVAEVAARGAEVVRQTGVLDRVARVVEAQSTAYAFGADRPDAAGGNGRRGAHGGDGSADEVRAAAILRVANDFEDLCNAEPGPLAHTDAMARIRLGDGGTYDPQVVAALARLVRAF